MKDFAEKIPFFIGIGGSGMSALAHIVLDMDIPVFGSDKSQSKTVSVLAERGAKIIHSTVEFDFRSIDYGVYSSAIGDENEFFRRMQDLGIPLFHRSELLHKIFSKKKSISVAGSHGKTSTTAMIAQILIEAGYDPAVMIGAETPVLSGRGGRWGKGEWGVYESDESDGTFLNHRADIKVLTNIDNDHLDHYKTIENLIQGFLQYIENPGNSQSILFLGDKGIGQCLKNLHDTNGISGFYESGDELFSDMGQLVTLCDNSLHFNRNGVEKEINLPFRGSHYLRNGFLALLTCEKAGVPTDDCIRSLTKYAGVSRRLEFLGTADNVPVYDDYGHHPTEISAVISSLALMKKEFPQSRTIVLFQPHRFTRTRDLFREFADALQLADFVFLLPVYPAGEDPIPGVSSGSILNEFPDKNNIKLLSGKIAEDTVDISEFIHAGDYFVCIGAGDVRKWGEQLVKK
ncbi:MAG: UDP-N-acetylmuramate--L-alanine ligase [Leptospira sp.]|nr:UDP-N-acetylmuramate--L-alanine ligase [Leptospira sp.]